MARLPTAADLGEPSFATGRPVARYDTSALTEGAARLGQGVQRLGAGLSEIADAREQDQAVQAKARYQIEKAKLDLQYSQDSNWEGLTDRYRNDLKRIAEASRDTINSPRARNAFEEEVGVNAAQSIAKMDGYRHKLEADAYVAGLNADGEGLREVYLNAPDEADRQEAIKTFRDRLGLAVARGFVSRKDAEETGRTWLQDAAEAKIKMLPPEERIAVLRGGGSLVDRITQAESSGQADAQNPDSSARGLGQFINSTWLRTVRKYAPELAKGRDDSAILALRDNPKISRAMTEALASENQQGLRAAGLDASDGNTYLAHFAGLNGATKLLKADPSTPVEKLLDADAIKANPFLKGKTAAEVIAWAHGKVGKTTSGLISEIPTDKRAEMLVDAEREQAGIDKELFTAEKNAATERRQALERDGYDLMLNDQLTPDWLAEHRDEIGVSTYKTLAKSLAKQTGSQTDEAEHIRLLELVDTDPEQAVEDAKVAYREDRIARDVFQSILSKSKQEVRRDRAWEKDVRGFVRRSLDFGQTASSRQKERQVNALFAFDDWLAKNPQSSREEAMKEAKEMVADFRRGRSAETRATTPMPQDVAATRDTMTMDDIATAKAAVIAKLKAGQITREDAIREAAILQRWQKALQDAEDDPLRLSKPFRTPEAPRPPLSQQQAPQAPETAPQRPERRQAPQEQQGNVFAPDGLLNRFDPITGQYLGR